MGETCSTCRSKKTGYAHTTESLFQAAVIIVSLCLSTIYWAVSSNFNVWTAGNPSTHTHTHTHTPTHMESSSTSLLFGHSDTRHGDSQGAGGSGLSLLMSQRRKTSDHLNNIPKQVNVTKTHYYDLWWQKARGCTYCERKTLSYWQKSQLGRQHITLAVKISPNLW